MPIQYPPKKNAEYILYARVKSRSTPNEFQTNPTIAAGDFKISKDGGAFTNLTNLPAVTPAGGKVIKFIITATEMNADNICIDGHDQAGDEWVDIAIDIQPESYRAEDLIDAIWDEVVTAGAHNVKNSAATFLRKASGGVEVTLHTGTAQSGTTNTIQLDTLASTVDDVYNGNIIALTGATGAGQTRRIVDYIGSTRTAYVDSTWIVNPNNTTTFDVIAAPSSVLADEGVAQGAGSNYIDLASTASDQDDTYNNSLVSITSGTGSGQTKVITDYTGSTRRASIAADTWSVTPDNTSVYAVIPSSTTASDSGTPVSVPTASEVAEAVWMQIVESDLDAIEVMRILIAALAGIVNGAPGGPINFRDIADTKNRIVAIVDGNGNRTAITLDGS